MRLAAWRHQPAGPWTEVIVRRAPHVLTTVHGDESVLFDPERQRYYTLNAVGGRVWALIEGGTSMSELLGSMGREYDVPGPDGQHRLARDVAALLEALRAARLIEAGS